MAHAPDTLTLIYDADCPLCRGAADWVRQRARAGAIRAIPCQSAERARLYPSIPFEECMRAMQVVTPRGAVFAGEAALPLLLERIPRWRWLARALRLPGVRGFAPRAYRWVARHRHTLSVIVAHKAARPGDACGPGTDCR